jgi:hypothetical protein
MAYHAPHPTSGFLAIHPQVQPVFTFHNENDAILFQSGCAHSHVGKFNKTWVYLPFPTGLTNSHYTVASKNFTFEFDSDTHAKAFNDYIHKRGDLKIHVDGTHPSQNYFRVRVHRV